MSIDTHGAEVVAILSEVPSDVVLVGHSYGGSVITGAADAEPERVRALVYLDAFGPADGSPFTATAARLRSAPDWTVRDSGHPAQRDA